MCIDQCYVSLQKTFTVFFVGFLKSQSFEKQTFSAGTEISQISLKTYSVVIGKLSKVLWVWKDMKVNK